MRKCSTLAKIWCKVVPVNTEKGMAPASLGLLTAYAMEYDGGRLNERYDFVPMFLTDRERLVDRASTPGVYFFFKLPVDRRGQFGVSGCRQGGKPSEYYRAWRP